MTTDYKQQNENKNFFVNILNWFCYDSIENFQIYTFFEHFLLESIDIWG